MKIISSASAFPPNYYHQKEITNALSDFWSGSSAKKALVDRFHRSACVDGRYLTVTLDQFRRFDNWGETNDVWIEAAEQLGEEAVNLALERAGISPLEVNALFFVSITGIANPSIDARLMNRIAFSRHLKRVPIFGLGCVAGAAGIGRAADYLAGHHDQVAVLLSVELCSLTWQRHDYTTANIISTGLFGDGACAIVLAGKEIEAGGPQIIDSRSIFYPGTEELMGWNISHEGLKVMLSANVPKVVFDNLGGDVDAFLQQHGLSRDDIGLWIMHTGGPKVLEAMANSLSLPRQALAHSWRWLNKVGNLSSASVLVVLDDIMRNERPEPGTWSLLAAMGPGFCSELVLIKW